MDSLSIGGAVFLLKVPSRSGVKVPQIFYDRNQEPIIIEPGTQRWNEMMGRFKIAEYLISPELWDAARSIDFLKTTMMKGRKEIKIAIKLTEGGLGDMIMMTNVPKAFKEAFGNQIKITVFTTEHLAKVLGGNETIDEIKIGTVGYDSPEFASTVNGNLLEMKAQHLPDDCQGERKSRTQFYLQQLGLWLVDKKPIYRVSQLEREWAREVFPGPFIAVQMKASNVAKTYPRMKEVVSELVKCGYDVVVLDEQDKNGYKYSVRQAGAIIERALVTVTPDSFAFHLAGALGKRVVGVFGSTDGEVFAQDYEKATVVQAPCGIKDWAQPCWWDLTCIPGHTTREKENIENAHCLSSLSPVKVMEAVEHQLKKHPKILIAMLTFDLLNMTKKALASIRSFYDYDVMVVDNESKDGTVEWLRKNGIRFVSKRTSVAAAQNIAMREFLKKNYDLFIFLNNDIVLRADYIDKLVASQARTKAWGIAGTPTQGVAPWAVDDAKLTDLKDSEVQDIAAGAYSATLLTRECIEKVGLFDEMFFPRYIEDNDYTLRIRLTGGKFFDTTYARFYHVLGAVVNSKADEGQSKTKFWDYNLGKFQQKWGILPHEPQIISKLGLEWFSHINGKSILEVVDEFQEKKEPVFIHRNMGGWGDVIFTSVIARELVSRFPKLQVVYAFRGPFVEALKGNPYINHFVAANGSGRQYGHFDLTDVEFRVELQEQERFGKIVSPRTRIYLDVFGLDGDLRPDYFPERSEIEWAKREWGSREKKIAVVPEGSNGTKNWPGMREMISRLGSRNIIELNRNYSFRQAAALIALSDVVVSPDTGLSNVAGALGKPTVAIFGNRSAKPFQDMFGKSFREVRGKCEIAPEGCDYFIPCLGHAPSREKELHATELDCMKRISVDEVLSIVEEMM